MDMVHSDFMMCLVSLVKNLLDTPPEGLEAIQVRNDRGSLVHMIRENTVKAAMEYDPTHILFLDSDMIFPEDAFHRLSAHDLDIVGCNYVQRKVPCIPNAVTPDGKAMFTHRDSTGLEEMLSAGFGVMLIKADVFRKIESPWFDTYYNDKGKMVGEDVYFFFKAREAGFVPYIDHDLSKEVGHIGTFEYTNFMAEIE